MPFGTQFRAEVTRAFPVGAERVYAAWLDPEQICKWFGPGLGEMVRVEVDARVGGTFSIVQRRGGVDIDHVGEYLTMVEPERLAFTWAVRQDLPGQSSRVYIEIAPKPRGCQLTLIHALPEEWADYVPSVTNSWAKMLEAMAEALA